ncbi:Hyphally regulated cell wall protein 3, partial [Candida tropicalis]
MAFWKLLLTAYLLVNPVFGIDITEDKVDRGAIDLSAGDITIHSGASWSIINNALTSILGSVEVQEEAGLYITSTLPLLALEVTLTSLIDSITNDGVIAFNSVASLTSATYNLVGASFTNNGEMYLGASGLLPSLMSITAADWTNEGLLVFYQNQRTSGVVTLGAVLPIKNNGQICLFHETYQQSTPITGSGCITTQVDSLIYFPNSLLSVDSAQSIYLADRKSSIIVQALSAPQTFNVYGFGNGNKIGLSVPLAGALVTSPYSYDSKTGILTLRAAVLSQKFNIGTGYDSRNFEIVTDSAGGLLSTLKGSVRYNGPVPERELPEACQIPCK